MKKSNNNIIKIPFIFRVGVLLLCALFITNYMINGFYARYTSSAIDSSSSSVAKISYKITTASSLSEHQLDVNDLPNGCNIVAVDETFTIENDGEVEYNYTIALSITDTNGQTLADYKLLTPSNKVWLLSDGIEAEVGSGVFYYYLNGELGYTTSPTLTGTLAVGEKVTYLVYYFVNFDNATLDKEMVLKYNIRCEQID